MCIFLCYIIGHGFFITQSVAKYRQTSLCSSANLEDTLIDRQDEWQYQNSITGEWHHWGTVDKNQSIDAEWPIYWLNVPPTSYLGVIVYLTRRTETDSLRRSFTQLSRLLSNNPRPVAVFHEGDLDNSDIQRSLAQTLDSRTPLAFQRIYFSSNFNRPQSVHRTIPLSYYDMCRFFTLMLPNHPLVTLFSFYWRLDSHSYIFGKKPIKDPFEIMQKRQIQYAYIMVNEEAEHYATELWKLFHQFLNDHCLKPSTALRRTQINLSGGYSHAIIFTNFAIANVSLFRDHPQIRAWLRTVDQNGGIYRYRWGDAPIHTLALTQFIERDHIVRLRYFGYMHRREYVCANGIEGKLCKEQVQPFLTDPRTEYLNYDDGCYPSSQNPLCHYYPDIRI
jgi:alpha 1,2-mannosyltransferase